MISVLLFTLTCTGGCDRSSSLSCRTQLQLIKTCTPVLRTRLDTLQNQGADVAYPLVYLTVLEQFADLAAHSFDIGKTERGCREVAELQDIALKCATELDALEAGTLLPDVPRYISSSRSISGGAFKATVRWPDGSETTDWPVIFSGYGHFETLIADIELMPDYGTHIIQIEVGPSNVLVADNETDLTHIHEVLIDALDRAWDANIVVDLLLSPDYLPGWVFETWPEIIINAGEYIPFSVDSPTSLSFFKKYLEALVPEIADHPALNGLCLTNEPSYFDATRDSENRPAYTSWLLETYGSLDAVAAAHGEDYSSFADVPIFYVDTKGFILYPLSNTSLPQRYDYYRFNDYRFAAFHQWMADTIHALAPDVPVHVKISDYSHRDPFEGIDPEQFMAFSGIAGHDSANYYTADDPEEVYANQWLFQNMFFDLLHSLSGLPLFNSENHIVRDFEKQMPPAAHIRNVLWQSAVHGQCASTVWVWERYGDNETIGLSDFTAVKHSPALVVEHGRTALDLLRLGREINALQQAPARVAILYSPTSLIYDLENYTDLMTATYEALSGIGEKIAFITEQGIARLNTPYPLIIAPGVTHIPDDVFTGLQQFVADNNTLVLIGDKSLAYDQLHNLRTETLPMAVQMENGISEELHAGILPFLDSLPGGRPLKIIDTATEVEPWGVEWRWVEYHGKYLISVTNYNKSNVSIRFEGIQTRDLQDLISMQPVNEPLQVAPLATYLIAVPKSS